MNRSPRAPGLVKWIVVAAVGGRASAGRVPSSLRLRSQPARHRHRSGRGAGRAGVLLDRHGPAGARVPDQGATSRASSPRCASTRATRVKKGQPLGDRRRAGAASSRSGRRRRSWRRSRSAPTRRRRRCCRSSTRGSPRGRTARHRAARGAGRITRAAREERRVADRPRHGHRPAEDRLGERRSRSRRSAAREQLELERELQVAKAALDTANWNLEQQTLSRPIDGVVLDRPLSVGTRLAINDHVMRVADVRPEKLVMRARSTRRT